MPSSQQLPVHLGCFIWHKDCRDLTKHMFVERVVACASNCVIKCPAQTECRICRLSSVSHPAISPFFSLPGLDELDDVGGAILQNGFDKGGTNAAKIEIVCHPEHQRNGKCVLINPQLGTSFFARKPVFGAQLQDRRRPEYIVAVKTRRTAVEPRRDLARFDHCVKLESRRRYLGLGCCP